MKKFLIKELAIGQFKSFIVLVTCAITNPNGEILILRRSMASKTFPGFWQMPEGKIEFGEQPLETLEREIKEELSVKLLNPSIKHASTFVFPVRGKKFHLLRIIASAKIQGKIKLSGEHTEYKWAKMSPLSQTDQLVPGTKEVLKVLRIK